MVEKSLSVDHVSKLVFQNETPVEGTVIHNHGLVNILNLRFRNQQFTTLQYKLFLSTHEKINSRSDTVIVGGIIACTKRSEHGTRKETLRR